jgi:hypothetical protein
MFLSTLVWNPCIMSISLFLVQPQSIYHVRNEEVLHRDSKESKILHTVTRRMANWFGHILRRTWHTIHVLEGKIEGRIWGTGRLWRRRKQLPDDPNERRKYWELKQEALDRDLWGTSSRRGCGPVVRQTAKRRKCKLESFCAWDCGKLQRRLLVFSVWGGGGAKTWANVSLFAYEHEFILFCIIFNFIIFFI